MSDFEKYYHGFFIDKAKGNNAFSYQQRKYREIFVAPIINGTPQDLRISGHVSFSEVVESEEQNFNGLEHFIHWENNGKHCFIFDNHNHAFFFWAWAFKNNIIGLGETLLHIDQHSDMRQPDNYINENSFKNLEKVFNYTNFVLNVGNFIQPALKIGLISTIVNIDNSMSFDKTYNAPYLLDLDIDIFSDEMDYIDDNVKIRKIKEWAGQAKFITVATSPFFINQQKAIAKIKEIFVTK